MKIAEDIELELPVTPMVDMVFQLIIFFIVVAATQNDVVDANIKLAEARNAPAIEKMEGVIINVAKNGEINIACKPVSLEQLRYILTQTRQEAGDRTTVVVRCDGDSMFREVDKIIAVIGKAGLYRVRIAAIAGGKK